MDLPPPNLQQQQQQQQQQPIHTALDLIKNATQLDREQRASEAVWFYDQGLVYLQLAFNHEKNEKAKKIIAEKFQSYADRSAELKEYLEKQKRFGERPANSLIGVSSVENLLHAAIELSQHAEREEWQRNIPLAYQLYQKTLEYLSQAYLMEKSPPQTVQLTDLFAKYGSKLSQLEQLLNSGSNYLNQRDNYYQNQLTPQEPINLMDQDFISDLPISSDVKDKSRKRRDSSSSSSSDSDREKGQDDEEEDEDNTVLHELPNYGDVRTLSVPLTHVHSESSDLFQKPLEVKTLGNFWNSIKPVFLNCSFDKSTFSPNEFVHIRMIIENHSSRTITCVRVSVIRKGNTLKASDGVLSDLMYDLKATARSMAGDDSYMQLKQQQMAPYREKLYSISYQPEGKFPLPGTSYYRGIVSYQINKELKPTDKHQPTMFTREYELLIELVGLHSNDVQLIFPIIIL